MAADIDNTIVDTDINTDYLAKFMEAKNAVFDHAVFKPTKDLPPLEITRDAKEKDSITPTHNIPAGGHFVIFI